MSDTFSTGITRSERTRTIALRTVRSDQYDYDSLLVASSHKLIVVQQAHDSSDSSVKHVFVGSGKSNATETRLPDEFSGRVLIGPFAEAGYFFVAPKRISGQISYGIELFQDEPER